MRAPEKLRGAVLTEFDATPPDWVCTVQAIIMDLEGHSLSVRDFADRWKMSKSKAHRIVQIAKDPKVRVGLAGLGS